MRIKRFVLFITLLLLPLTLVGCQNNDGFIKIGILQFMETPALTDAKDGFIKGLELEGYIEGENVRFDIQNPHGNQNEMQTMSKVLLRNNDLVFGIATPAASSLVQTAKEENIKKPILFSAVTDPVASKLIDSNENPGSYVTGTNDMNPVIEQIALAKELLPNAKKIGILYNSNEENSQIQADIAKSAATLNGLTPVEVTFSSINNLQSIATNLANSVDIIYTPTDNAVAGSIGLLDDIAVETKTPFIVGEDTLVSHITSLTIGVNYYNLGLETAKMAVDILKDGKSPSDIPSTGLTNFELVINKTALDKIGVTVPDSLLKRADLII